jgi:hypothetical protein
MATLATIQSSRVSKRVKYLVLMKLNVFLGASFILQELPQLLLLHTFLRQFLNEHATVSLLSDLHAYQGVTIVLMAITYVIGKPIDLLIYAGLSSSFRTEMRKFVKKLACKR